MRKRCQSGCKFMGEPPYVTPTVQAVAKISLIHLALIVVNYGNHCNWLSRWTRSAGGRDRPDPP